MSEIVSYGSLVGLVLTVIALVICMASVGGKEPS
jgi:hypothetical protein